MARWKKGRREVSEKVTECSVTQIAGETFCFKSDLAVKRQLRIAQSATAPLFLLLWINQVANSEELQFHYNYRRKSYYDAALFSLVQLLYSI